MTGICAADMGFYRARAWVKLRAQVWAQLRAENVDEFKQAVAMQQMPMFTYIYADHRGDTFIQSNSWTPDYSGSEYRAIRPPIHVVLLIF